jgi:hypothetical protein
MWTTNEHWPRLLMALPRMATGVAQVMEELTGDPLMQLTDAAWCMTNVTRSEDTSGAFVTGRWCPV